MSRKYSGDGIDVFYEAPLCIHAKECVHGLPDVFDPEKRPWIEPRNAPAAALVTTIERCPTGALHYELADGAPEAPDASSVRLVPNGPLYVRGDVTLRLPDGTIVRHDTRLALCRCGDSKNKPYCDNSHIAAGFADRGSLIADR
jgi:uncharacterized Fe-S cluster protein YjdI/CDGSH-type Zn-finger protein